MIHFTIFVFITAIVALSFGASAPSDENAFEEFKTKFNKNYASKNEEQRAMTNFLKHKKDIDEHNKLYDQGKTSYQMNLFEHSDLSEDEMFEFLSGFDESYDDSQDRSKRAVYSYPPGHFPPGPASINWTERGIVGPIGNQSKQITFYLALII